MKIYHFTELPRTLEKDQELESKTQQKMKKLKQIKFQDSKLKLTKLISSNTSHSLQIYQTSDYDLSALVYTVSDNNRFFKSQLKALQTFKENGHILDYIDHLEVAEGIQVILTQRLEKESLEDIRSKKAYFSDMDILEIAFSISSVLEEAHSKGYVTYSVSPDNVYLVENAGIEANNFIARSKSSKERTPP